MPVIPPTLASGLADVPLLGLGVPALWARVAGGRLVKKDRPISFIWVIEALFLLTVFAVALVVLGLMVLLA